MRTAIDTEPAAPAEAPTEVPTQGDISTLDEDTRQEAVVLRKRMGGAEQPQRTGFFIWGSIRILAVYGKWSWWRKPKRQT
jgi:hypothetical protein